MEGTVLDTKVRIAQGLQLLEDAEQLAWVTPRVHQAAPPLLRIVVEALPPSVNTLKVPRHNGPGMAYSAEAKAFLQYCRQSVAPAHLGQLQAFLAQDNPEKLYWLHLHLVWPTNALLVQGWWKTNRKGERARATKGAYARKDASNYLKLAEDGLVEMLGSTFDDARIFHHTITKQVDGRAATPRLYLRMGLLWAPDGEQVAL